MNPKTPLRHWRLEESQEIAWLTLDVAGASANTLSRAVLEEFEFLLQDLERAPYRGLVIRSGKAGGFIAGADVNEFRALNDAVEASQLARRGQQAFDRLARLPFPTVALIHGYCLGGGMELALACRYRIARADDAVPGSTGAAGTRLGVPEVKLGIHPGFGGTVRLPPLIGDLAALDLMLTGRTLGARAARKLGLVDELVPERHLVHAAQGFIARPPARRRPSLLRRLPGFKPLRPLVAALLARKLRSKADPDHYPAPWRILELWRAGAAQEQEARSIGELLTTRTSHNLVRLFLLGEDLKRRGRPAAHDEGPGSNGGPVPAAAIRHVHVIGAGVMGADIAIWAAARGFFVSLQDRHPEPLARAVQRADAFYRKKLKDARAVQAALDRLMPDPRGHGVRRADLVIEAIVENVAVKSALFAGIEKIVKPDALLATNTSSIPLETLGQALTDPARLVGLHFFNPVAQMQLVEIVRGAHTGEPALARARAFTVALDRLPLEVKSSPGFLVNRVLMPYLLEAVTLAEEGVAIAAIDRAARKFGMPMGPILLADTVGLDICLSVAEMLAGPLGVRVPEALRRQVARGELGKKTGKGFYRYDRRGRPQGGAGAETRLPVTERLVLRLLNEAMACLREGVVGTPDEVDAGMVYGTGFAPFHGGPMAYARGLGAAEVRAALSRLAREYDARFAPDPGWSDPALTR